VDDLERLVRRLPLPEPSADLDRAILAPAAVPPRRGRAWRPAAFLATAACTGLLGFVLGRETAAAPRGEQVAAPRAVVPVPTAPAGVPDASVVRMEIPAESLSAFAVASSRPSPPWGGGPVDLRVTQSDR